LQFTWRDASFYYAGTNCYYLSYFSADPARRGSIDDLLDLCLGRGFNVIRAWAFNDGGSNIDGYPNEWAYQDTPTSLYNETALRGLDYAVDHAGRRGLKLILTFTNNWDDYGGMQWYVDASPSAAVHDEFYSDLQCKEWFKARMQTIITRVNTYNGIAYKDDPAIFAWELASEPRCWDDSGSEQLVFRTWADEMSTFIKSLDPNHLVTTGVEGFYNCVWGCSDWIYDGATGTDFIADHALPNIDFCTMHLWPDHWNLSDAAAMVFLQRHLDDAANVIRKPIVLEEFGVSGDEGTAALQEWTDAVFASASTNGAAPGWHVWMIEADGSGHDDGYSLTLPDDQQTIDLLTIQAQAINGLTAPDADVNVDGVVNVLDMIAIRNDLGATPGSDGYIRADVNRDGWINILDMIVVRNAFGTTWP
ncbi:MAG: cellulase family glycosylhydrolase, partial [Planctomycetes bacterium]|nr:cellulase family glycosylhydrolase [Planctomycetota bacterium]